MPENQSFHDSHQWAWDATSLELAQTCLRKYYYSMILGIQPKNKSVHLLFGGLYAKALENFYKHRAEGDSISEAQIKVVRQAMIDSWDTEAGRPLAFEDVKKTRPNLIRTIIWYIEQFAEESEDGLATYHLANGKPAVELSFGIELTEEIIYCGHLDRVVTMGDHLFIMDQKTTGGTLSDYYFRSFDTSLQMTGYSFAGRAVLSSPVRGVIVDAAQIAVNFTQFQRAITVRTAAQIDEWLESVQHTIQTAWRAADTGFWPLNYSSCEKYGGCPFRELCTSDPKIRDNYIKSDFTEKTWDPIQQR